MNSTPYNERQPPQLRRTTRGSNQPSDPPACEDPDARIARIQRELAQAQWERTQQNKDTSSSGIDDEYEEEEPTIGSTSSSSNPFIGFRSATVPGATVTPQQPLSKQRRNGLHNALRDRTNDPSSEMSSPSYGLARKRPAESSTQQDVGPDKRPRLDEQPESSPNGGSLTFFSQPHRVTPGGTVPATPSNTTALTALTALTPPGPAPNLILVSADVTDKDGNIIPRFSTSYVPGRRGKADDLILEHKAIVLNAAHYFEAAVLTIEPCPAVTAAGNSRGTLTISQMLDKSWKYAVEKAAIPLACTAHGGRILGMTRYREPAATIFPCLLMYAEVLMELRTYVDWYSLAPKAHDQVWYICILVAEARDSSRVELGRRVLSLPPLRKATPTIVGFAVLAGLYGDFSLPPRTSTGQLLLSASIPYHTLVSMVLEILER
ncbi:hypothetical protein B0H19DRAFT_1073160 [Mycena capillaripes]|nr:hypothetical protein B0H19DRAFT_1073160 [Mycena capillaripes]